MSVSCESSMLTKHLKPLRSLVQQDVNAVADALAAKGVIEAVDFSSSGDKVTSVLNHVMKAVEDDSYKWQTFLQVLGSLDLANASSLIETIEVEYRIAQKQNGSPYMAIQSAMNETIRQRKSASATVSHEGTNDDDDDDDDDEKDTTITYLPVWKGIGSVVLLSLFMWIGFMYLYKPPLSNN